MNAHPILQKIEQANARAGAVVDFRVGDTVRVHVKIKEGEKERVQVFEGVVIKRTRNGLRASFIVRKVSYGVGVERVFPLHSPAIDKIEVKAHGEVRRARLYYLRDLQGKAARIREKQGEGEGEASAEARTDAKADAKTESKPE
jgi:large subunit ribosomal protein L19